MKYGAGKYGGFIYGFVQVASVTGLKILAIITAPLRIKRRERKVAIITNSIGRSLIIKAGVR